MIFYTHDRSINLHQNEFTIFWLLIVAGGLMVIVHAYDDVLGLSPWIKLFAQTEAVIIILGPWIDQVFHGVLLSLLIIPLALNISIPTCRGIVNLHSSWSSTRAISTSLLFLPSCLPGSGRLA